MTTSLAVEPRDGWGRMVRAELSRRTPEQQVAFTEEYDSRKKKTDTARWFWLFGWHYAYLGMWGEQILFLITLYGFFVWWLVDGFRVRDLVRKFNTQVATSVLRDMCAIWGQPQA